MTHLLAIYDEGRTGDVYLGFSTAFQTLSYNILVEKLVKYKLDKGTMRWTEHTGWTARLSGLWPVA